MARYPGLLMNPNIAPRATNIRQAKEAPLLAQFQGGTQAARIPAPRPIQVAADNSLGQGLSQLGKSLSDIGKMNRDKAAAESLSSMYVPAAQVTENMTGPEAMGSTPTANQLMQFGFKNIGTPAGKQALIQAQNLATIDANRATRAFDLQKQENLFAQQKEIQGMQDTAKIDAEKIKAGKIVSGDKTLDAYTALFTKTNKTAPERARLAALRQRLQLPKQIGTDVKGNPLFSQPLNMNNVDKSMTEALGAVQAALPSADVATGNNVGQGQSGMVPTANVNIGVGPGLELPPTSIGEPVPNPNQPKTQQPSIISNVNQPPAETSSATSAQSGQSQNPQDQGIVSILNPTDVDPEVTNIKSEAVYKEALKRNAEIKNELSAGRKALRSLLQAKRLSPNIFSGGIGQIGSFFSDMSGNLGGPEAPGSVAAKEFDVLMKQQILPGLRQFFGSAFSAKESEIGMTLGASIDMPPQKRMVLIDQAIARIQQHFDEKASELARVNKGDMLTKGITVNKMSLAPTQIERLDADGVKQMFAIREFLTPKQIMALEKAANRGR